MNIAFGLLIGLTVAATSSVASAGEKTTVKPVASLHGLNLTFIAGAIRTNCALKTPENCKNSDSVWVSPELQHWTQVRVREYRHRAEVLLSREEEGIEIGKVLGSCPKIDSSPVTKQDTDLEVGCKAAIAALTRNEEQQEEARKTLSEVAKDSVIFDKNQTVYTSPTGYGATHITDSRNSLGQRFVVPMPAKGSTDFKATYMFSAGDAQVHTSARSPMEIVAKTSNEVIVGKCESTPGARYLFGHKVPFSDETQIVCIFPNGTGYVRFAVR